VLKDSQKSIIVGKKGEMIKKLGQDSRLDIAEIAGTKVHLFLFVKVKVNNSPFKEIESGILA
jgi:GTP-binding protein Era